MAAIFELYGICSEVNMWNVNSKTSVYGVSNVSISRGVDVCLGLGQSEELKFFFKIIMDKQLRGLSHDAREVEAYLWGPLRLPIAGAQTFCTNF